MVLYTFNHAPIVISLYFMGPKLTQKGSILMLFKPKCNFFTQLVHISSKYIYMVFYTCIHTPMVTVWGFWLYLSCKIESRRVNFDTFRTKMQFFSDNLTEYHHSMFARFCILLITHLCHFQGFHGCISVQNWLKFGLI